MALAITLLDSTNDASNDAEIVSGSVSPTGDALLVVIASMNDSSANAITGISDALTGTGSWTEQASAFNDNYDAGNNDSECAIFTAVAGSSPGSGAITVTLSGNSTRKNIHVYEVTGYDTTTPVEQAASNTATEQTSLTVTLSASPAASSLVIGGVCVVASNNALVVTPGTGFTEGAETYGGNANQGGSSLQTQYDNGGADTTCDWSTLPSTAYADCESGVAIEINEDSSGYTLTAAQGSLTFAGQAATPKAARKLTAAFGSLTFTGQAATPKAGRKLTAAQGSLTISGQAAGLTATRKLTAAFGSLTIAGQAAGLSRGYPLTAAQGSLTISGQAAGLAVARKLTAAFGSLTIAGQAADLVYSGAGGYELTAAQGSLTFAGQATGLAAARKLTAAQGSLTISGQAATPKAGRKLTAAQGSLTISGQAAGLAVARQLTAAYGSLTIAGQAADLVYSAAGSYTLTAAYGSLTISGQAAGLAVARQLTAAQGTFTLSGADVVLLVARLLAMGYGSLTFTGQAATLNYSAVDVPDDRVFTIQAESRVYGIEDESRVLAVSESDRVKAVK